MDDYSQNVPNAHPSQQVLAHLSYAPTITETIVTTKTITKTAYPPFVLQAPRSLADRDPELYPLAIFPTPELLRKVRLDIGGKQAFFEEAAHPEAALYEVSIAYCVLAVVVH